MKLNLIIFMSILKWIKSHFSKNVISYIIIIITAIACAALIKYCIRKKNGGPWRLSTVVYYIDDTVPFSVKYKIIEVMNEITEISEIKFRERNKVDVAYINIIYVENDVTQCTSIVGCHDSKQNVTLGSYCLENDGIKHELMHAIGFVHEQSRPDRDDYININYDNIEPSKRHNYDKQSNFVWDNIVENTEYDLKSILHYSGVNTMSDKAGGIIKKNINFSEGDVIKLKKYYKLYKDYTF